MSDIPRSPNVFHPTKPSAVGSRNSLAQEGRDQKDEFQRLIQEEADSVLKDMQVKLPSEVLKELDVMGGLKEKIYNYYNQNYQNMFNRYIVTAEDEMVKKVRNYIDKEENKALARYTPKEIAEMLDQIGGADKFNTGEVEKSMVNMYGHLQGHIQRGMNDLENETNALLRQKTDVGAFIRGENAYSIIKCAFKDNAYKPKTITDVKLSVNILDSELISPIFHYQVHVEHLIKDQISRTITNLIDHEVEAFQEELIDEGQEELTDSEVMFEKMKRVPNYTDDDAEDENSKRYTFLAMELMKKIEGLRAEIPQEEFDSVGIRENLKQIVDTENIRNRGFNTAVNSLTAILDTSKMGYQYIENLKNARELVVKEYEDNDVTQLPDERYQIRLKFYDAAQLEKERDAYVKQVNAFRSKVNELFYIVEDVYQGAKGGFSAKVHKDYKDIVKSRTPRVAKMTELSDIPLLQEEGEVWNEIMRIRIEDTDVERLNTTFLHEKKLLAKMMTVSREKIVTTFGYENPIERVQLDKRIDYLKKEFDEFDYIINPFHVQPGLVLDVDITSIKRKKFTLSGMANVLNEFLHGVSKGFQDAAFASFKRRRSTVRTDIAQSFGASTEDAPAPAPKGRVLPTAAAESKDNVKGSADVTPTRRRKKNSGDLQEL